MSSCAHGMCTTFHAPQCFQYRVIEINGHWRHWFNDIVSAWRDRILPDEQVIFDIVHPNPPRTAVPPQGFLFDIILTQGLAAPRRGGLVTILQRDDIAQRAHHAVAVSLPETVSGYQIVQSAESTHECNVHQCIIRHGNVRLPYTMAPVHDMQDGDSFTVAVNTRVPDANVSMTNASQDMYTSDHAPEEDQDPEDIPPQDGNEELDEEQPGDGSPVPSPSVASTLHARQGVHIHRLGHTQIFGRPRWDTVDHVLYDIAILVGEPFDHLMHCHHLQVAPDDVAPHEDSIIVQHVNDIPPGSTEKLVLVDIEMHTRQHSEAAPRAPVVSRQVHRVVPTMVRRHLLHITRTVAYCDWHPHECLVFCNRILWHLHDLGPRRIAHGMYFRVVLPPPLSVTWEISHALRVFHEAYELFDPADASRIAERVLNEGQSWPPPDSGTSSQLPHLTCKGIDLDHEIDIPMMLPPHVRVRRPRPAHDGTETWLLDLGQIFSEQAEAETIDGDAYLYVQTWYIDHDRHRICRRPRPMRLEPQAVVWIDDFRHEWRDMLDRSTFFSIYVIKPKPPQFRHMGYACHVLLEQNRPRGGAAGILTALFAGFPNDAIMQHAYATPRFLTQQDLIDLMEISHVCEGRRCRAFHFREPIHIVPATEVNSGFSIRLHVDPPSGQMPIPPSAPGYFDDLVLMQRPMSNAPFQSIQEINSNSSGNESIPQDWIIDLQRVVQSHVDSCDYEEQAEFIFSVYTWFLDHQKHTICRDPKIVFLGRDIAEWREDLTQPWQHRIDPQEHVFLDLVQPSTRRAHIEDHLAHIILTQRQTDQSSILVSMEFVDETEPSVMVRTAVVALKTSTSGDLVHIVPLLQSFVHNRMVWSHPTLSSSAQPFSTWSGLSVHVKIYAEDVAEEGPSEHTNDHAVDLPRRLPEGAPFQFNPQAPPFQPGLGLPADAPEFIQDLHDQWIRVAFAWDTELENAWFITWFVDHRYELPRCLLGRTVMLTSDFTNWERTIQEAWRDVLDPNLRQERHVVVPQPPQLEAGVGGHIILIQEPREEWVTSLVTVFDSFISARENHMMRLAVTTHEHVSLEQIAQQSGYRLIAGQIDPNVPCQGWIDGHPLPAGHRWPGRSGHEITLRIHRQVMQLPVMREGDDQIGLLQTSVVRKEPGDNSRLALNLQQLIWPPEPASFLDLLAQAGQRPECQSMQVSCVDPLPHQPCLSKNKKAVRLIVSPQVYAPAVHRSGSDSRRRRYL